MREILDEVMRQLDGDAGFALVTLVSERGSTPRSAGAQMLVREDGSIAGTIGGGLLEATMMGQARAALSERCSRTTTMALAGRQIHEMEMMCGGHAEVLIAYVPPRDPVLTAVLRGLSDAVAQRRRAWMFTFFRGSPMGTVAGAGTPDECGTAPGASTGASTPAGDVSYCLLVEGGEPIGELPCESQHLRRLVGKIGVHGSAALDDGRQVYVEAVEPLTVAVICGAGHVAQALAPITEYAGFATTVLDDRPEFADRERFPTASRVEVLPSFDDAFAGIEIDERGYIIIVTRGHAHDFNVLVQALRTPARYVGLMSSRSKWARIEAELRKLGFVDADIARIHSPVGLSIGAETPAELAVSIVAEMIQARAGRA